MKFDRDLFYEFLSHTSGIEPKVCEFRHECWLNNSTYGLLEDHGAGFCIADTEETEPTFRVMGDLAYFRLRNDAYDVKTIDRWADNISQTSSGLEESYVYLRHDDTGENALLAQRLAEKLSRK